MGAPAGGYYEVADDVEAPSTVRRGRHGRVVASCLVVGLLVTAVLALRQPDRPAEAGSDAGVPAVPPGDSGPITVSLLGFAEAQLGQWGSDFRRAACGGPCLFNDPLWSSYTDSTHGCQLYRWSRDDATTATVWTIDARVVSVSVAANGAPARIATWPGVTFGDTLSSSDERLQGWAWDAAAPVPIATFAADDRVTTLADTDADGRLDYAGIATVPGQACEIGTDSVSPIDGNGAGPAIDGDSLQAVEIGMAPLEVLAVAGWSERDIGAAGTCRLFVHGDSLRAYAVDNAVIGLSAPAVVGGAAVGQTVAEVSAVMGPDQVNVESPSPQDLPEFTLRDAAGRVFILTAFPELVVTPQLDIPLVASTDPMDNVVHDIVLGSTCGGG